MTNLDKIKNNYFREAVTKAILNSLGFRFFRHRDGIFLVSNLLYNVSMLRVKIWYVEKNTHTEIQKWEKYTQRNVFKILLIQTEIRLYLPFSIDLETNIGPFTVPNQSANGKYNLFLCSI